MTLILIRHGESEANKKGRNQGEGGFWSDTPLSEKGNEQAEQVSQRLKTEKIDYIFSSDLKRAKETANKINKHHNKKIIFDKRIREKNYIETMNSFIKRIKEFLEYINNFKGKILIVAHGGVNLTILAISTRNRKKGKKLAKETRIHNTSVSVVERRGEHYDIKIRSDIGHLKPDKKIIELFEKIQKIPYKIRPYNKKEIDKKIKSGDYRHKSELLKKLAKKQGYKAKKLIVIFDWKDLPLPKDIINILKKSSTKQIHEVTRVKIHGNYLYLDPTWPKEFEKIGFPVTKNWSGLEDTKQITKGKLVFFKKNKFRKNKKQIINKYKIKRDNKEMGIFNSKLNKWLENKIYNK